jgi:hypothetical protein
MRARNQRENPRLYWLFGLYSARLEAHPEWARDTPMPGPVALGGPASKRARQATAAIGLSPSPKT